MTNNLSFTAWMKAIDKILGAKFGIGTDDLGDACYRDSYEAEVTPAEMAAGVIANDDLFSSFPAWEESL